jgi:hypothetical protein
MSKSDTKLLVSGCGISFSGQEAKTWVNILSLAGASIIDAGGPAVSNQWIINRAFEQLRQNPEIKKVVVQLTSMGKLDVEVDEERICELVESDPLRNFTVDNVWPSSASINHESKRLWRKYLFSPGLEQQDMVCKLILLKHWCNTHNIDLTVIQGYNLYWSEDHKLLLTDIISQIDTNIIDEYQLTEWYNKNIEIDVPVIPYQFELAIQIATAMLPEYVEKLIKIQSRI